MTSPKEGAENHTQEQIAEIKFFLQQLSVSWGLDKFRDKDGNWRGHIQRVEEDIPKVAVCYSVQDDECESTREGAKVKVEREQESEKGTMAHYVTALHH